MCSRDKIITAGNRRRNTSNDKTLGLQSYVAAAADSASTD